MKKKYEREIISDEKIYEPTGEFQPSGREVIYTRKTVTKYGKITVISKSNEPSEEAMKNFNRLLNKAVKEIVHRQAIEDVIGRYKSEE